MQKIKVFYLTYSPSPYRVDFFEQLGKKVDLTVCYETTPCEDDSKRNIDWYGKSSKNFKAIFLKKIYIFRKYISFDLIKILNQNKYDIIVIGGYSSLTAIMTMLYLKRKKTPFFLNTDGGFPKNNELKLKKKLKKYLMGLATYYLSSGNNANKYLNYYGVAENKIFKYPFTSLKKEEQIHAIISKNEKVKLRKELDIDENKIIFLYIGQFINRKAIDVLIKASKGLEKNCNVLIIGDKPTDKYIKLVQQLKIKNINFIDYKPKKELIKYLMASDVFVLPTREDIWGLVVNEALNFGLPVITTNMCGAGLDLIENGRNGFIFNVDNVKELHEKMKFFIKNDYKIKKMSRYAIDSVKDYTIENETDIHYLIFKKYLNIK